MDWVDAWVSISRELVRSYGYMGIFLVQLLASSSLFLPIPGFFVVIAAGATMNPLLVTILSALGGSVGELTGYIVGRGGRKLLPRRAELDKARRIYTRYGIWTIFIFAATPLPFDLIGILCGILELRPVTFFVMTLSGKLVLCATLAYTGRHGLKAFEDLLAGQINIFSAVFLLLMALFVLLPFIYWRHMGRNSQPNSNGEQPARTMPKYPCIRSQKEKGTRHA